MIDQSSLGGDQSLLLAMFARLDHANLGEQREKEFAIVIQRVADIAASFRSKKITIQSDPHLTDAGRRDPLKALIEQADRELSDATAPMVAELEATILDSQKALNAAVTPMRSDVDAARAIEVRRVARDLYDQLGLEELVARAAALGSDDFSVLAILDGPKIFPLISPAAEVNARRIMSERLLPDRKAALESHQDALHTLTSAIAAAHRDFGSVIDRASVGLAGDAISRAALGRGAEMVGPATIAPGG